MNSLYTVAFYNLENLFDTIKDPNTIERDFLPWGKKFWTENKYKKKVLKMGKAISCIAKDKTNKPPVIKTEPVNVCVSTPTSSPNIELPEVSIVNAFKKFKP